MIENEFMSEIGNYNRIVLGEVEELFLQIISLRPASAYDIFTGLRRDLNRPMNYRNVHTRIKKLDSYALIQRDEEDYKRGAIKYSITSHGLFHLLLNESVSASTMNEFKEHVIMKTIVYEFFETETIKKFVTIPRDAVLRDYVRECCEAIVKRLDEMRSSTRPDVDVTDIMASEIHEVIRNQVRKFVFQIISISKIKRRGIQLDYDYNKDEFQGMRLLTDSDEDEHGPNYASHFPKPALNQDEKFIKLLRELKKDFDNGCKDFI